MLIMMQNLPEPSLAGVLLCNLACSALGACESDEAVPHGHPWRQTSADASVLQVPEGVDSGAVIRHAMQTYELEIATGLPPIGGQAWRVGLLGYNANAANVALVVQAFREGLAAQGYC